MIATVPTAAPVAASADAGSATMGDSVPSKSEAISACAGSARIASSPAWPSAVAARTGGADTPTSCPAQPPRSLGARLRRPHSLPPRPLRPQPLDQHRIELERLRAVDQLVEQLVVPGRRDAEHLRDGLLLGASGAPRAPFEGQDAHVALGQRRHPASLQ